MTTIYVLECEDNCYYVGKTTRHVSDRFNEHKHRFGSSWTYKHKPIRILKFFEGDAFDEDAETKRMMNQHGIDRVRGGSWSRVQLDQIDKEFLTKELYATADRCHNCGQGGHFIRNCPYAHDSEEDWSEEEESIDITSDAEYACDQCGEAFDDYHDAVTHEKECIRDANNKCTRCGRQGHVLANCFAEFHRKGYVLDSDED